MANQGDIRNWLAELGVPEAARAEANRLVYEIALANSTNGYPKFQDGRRVMSAEVLAAGAQRLQALGFEKLAEKILDRCAPIRIEDEGQRLAVKAPYSEQATLLFRGIPNRRWDGERKVNVVPAAERRVLWQVLQRAYPGMVGVGPQGVFVVPGGTP